MGASVYFSFLSENLTKNIWLNSVKRDWNERTLLGLIMFAFNLVVGNIYEKTWIQTTLNSSLNVWRAKSVSELNYIKRMEVWNQEQQRRKTIRINKIVEQEHFLNKFNYENLFYSHSSLTVLPSELSQVKICFIKTHNNAK